MPTDSMLAAFGAAVKNLSFESETDAPFEPFKWPGADTGDQLTGKKVVELGGHGARELVVEQSFDTFFAPLVKEKEWHRDAERKVVAQYESLLKLLQRELTAIRVFRVGGVRKTIYVVGRTRQGGWAGIKTIGVET